MTPKERARELQDKFRIYKGSEVDEDGATMLNYLVSKDTAKQCALIAVDYLIKEQDMWQNGEVEPVKYWQSVKTEIEKL